MKEIILGTGNRAKIDQMKAALGPIGISVEGLPKDKVFPDIAEDQESAQGNARKKALAYSRALGKTVLSMDNALYFDGLAAELQPGLNVRRIPGHSDRPSDIEMLDYYRELVKKLGGKAGGYWEYALCVAGPNGVIDEISFKSHRTFVSEPCKKTVDGYPLESIQIDPSSGRYIADMSKEEQAVFWQNTIGKDVCEFISKL
jgi:XTP/dITP diphosphohydrolase